MGQDGARKSLVDSAVKRIIERLLAPLSEILAHTVENDDRVVE